MKREYSKARVGTTRTTKRKKPLDHLTRDVLAAEAAGTSYGKWKAANPHTGEEDDNTEELELASDKRALVCIRCGKTFLATNLQANMKYCSDECKARASQERDQERNPDKYQPKPCPVCGKLVQRDHGRVYCGEKCAEIAHRKKERERQRRKAERRKAANGSI